MQLADLKKAMKGVDIIQITPFNKDGSLDLEGMRANTRWLLERTAGKDFIFTPLGSCGELHAMSDDERKAVIKMVAEEVNGKNVVCPGTAQGSTRETIKMCQYAESVGADMAMVLLPAGVPTEEDMYQHYKQIAESINIGLMIYNSPGGGSWIKPPLMVKLSKIPNIIAVKEITPLMLSYYFMRSAVDPKDTAILTGGGEVQFSFEAVYGCPGFSSGVVNFAPDLSYSVYKAAVARNFDKLTELVDSMAPYFSFRERAAANHPHTGTQGRGGGLHIASYKEGVNIIGLSAGEARLPSANFNKEEKAELRDILRAMKIVN